MSVGASRVLATGIAVYAPVNGVPYVSGGSIFLLS
jgi:hypothetical protein